MFQNNSPIFQILCNFNRILNNNSLPPSFVQETPKSAKTSRSQKKTKKTENLLSDHLLPLTNGFPSPLWSFTPQTYTASRPGPSTFSPWPTNRWTSRDGRCPLRKCTWLSFCLRSHSNISSRSLS